MQRRGFVMSMLLGSLLSIASVTASALPLAPGVSLVSPAQPGGVNGQIEVLEFFSYGCPHCHEFEPKLSKWRASLPKDVVFRRVPIDFGRPEWNGLARIYHTLSAMQLSEKLDVAVFEAVHARRIPLWQEAERNQWLKSKDVDVRAFNDTWRSFGVDTQVRRSEQQAVSYRVNSVPLLAVDGRYLVQGEHDQILKAASNLIEQLRAEKKAAQPAAEKKK